MYDFVVIEYSFEGQLVWAFAAWMSYILSYWAVELFTRQIISQKLLSKLPQDSRIDRNVKCKRTVRDGEIKIEETVRIWRHFKHGWWFWSVYLRSVCIHVCHVSTDRPAATCSSFLRRHSEVFLCFVFIAQQRHLSSCWMLWQLR